MEKGVDLLKAVTDEQPFGMVLAADDGQHDAGGVLSLVHQDDVEGQALPGELEHLQIEIVDRRQLAVFHVGEDVANPLEDFVAALVGQGPDAFAGYRCEFVVSE